MNPLEAFKNSKLVRRLKQGRYLRLLGLYETYGIVLERDRLKPPPRLRKRANPNK